MSTSLNKIQALSRNELKSIKGGIGDAADCRPQDSTNTPCDTSLNSLFGNPGCPINEICVSQFIGGTPNTSSAGLCVCPG